MNKFMLIVTNRIAAHKDAEAKRLEAEREKIRREEEAKARAEAERIAQAERERSATIKFGRGWASPAACPIPREEAPDGSVYRAEFLAATARGAGASCSKSTS